MARFQSIKTIMAFIVLTVTAAGVMFFLNDLLMLLLGITRNNGHAVIITNFDIMNGGIFTFDIHLVGGESLPVLALEIPVLVCITLLVQGALLYLAYSIGHKRKNGV